MAASATQKTLDQAAALIQARVRGRQQRQRDARVLHAVTILQARQRGRYTRREYQRLLEFYNEQESFLQESKRRRLRLWHREQELYFLQHTTAEELDAIRAFQYERAARRIQRAWLELHPKPLEDVDVSGLGKPFDPFALGALASYGHLKTEKASDAAVPRAVVMDELYGELPRQAPWTVDEQKAAKRRSEIQERLQHRRKETFKAPLPHNAPTRRELYDQLVALRLGTAQRLDETREQLRARRRERDLEAARLSASCRHRVAFLLDETRVRSFLSASKRVGPAQEAERRRLESEASTWRPERQREAWTHHARVVQSVLSDRKWYETTLAGEQCDIRKVYAQSPWDHERQVWQWPRAPEDEKNLRNQATPAEPQAPTAMDRFRFCLRDDDCDGSDNQEEHLREDHDREPEERKTPLPVDDALASTWWRAHATQSHTSYKQLQERRLRLLRRTKLLSMDDASARHAGSDDAHVTPEMLANPALYALYKRTLEDARRQRVEEAVASREAQLKHQIRQQVVAVETHVELNTRRILEERARVLQQKARRTKEERAAVEIQRVARGRRGRKEAQDHLAQYFVMVRGRAIRKGKCEECGAAQAVLECRQCEESLHFCPTCWVQVHATRRRKTHVAIPMAVAVAVHTEQARVGGEKTARRPPPEASPPPPQPRSTAAIVLSSTRDERRLQPPKDESSGPSKREGVPVAATMGLGPERPRQDAAERVPARAIPNVPVTDEKAGVGDASGGIVATEPASGGQPSKSSAVVERPVGAIPVAEPPQTKEAGGIGLVTNAEGESEPTKGKATKSTSSTRKPQMSVRERMAAGKQKQQQEQEPVVPNALPAAVEPLASQAETVPSEPIAHNTAIAETLVAQSNPSEDLQPRIGPPKDQQEQAARKIQSLRRRYLDKQPDRTDKPQKASEH